MLTFTADATWGASEPLARLSELVEKRCEMLHETVQDAAVGTLIAALSAIRTQTLKAKPPRKAAASVTMRSEFVPSFSRKLGRKCLRNALGRRLDLSLRVAWVEPKGTPLRLLRVYYVKPQNGKVKPYLAVAKSARRVTEHETARVRRHIAAMGGLARRVLGLAAAKVSTRPAAADGAGMGAVKVAPRFAAVTFSRSGREGTIEVRDSLSYARLALKGGASTVDFALRRAANKIAGRLMRWAADNGNLGAAVSVPFPEVAGRRKGA